MEEMERSICLSASKKQKGQKNGNLAGKGASAAVKKKKLSVRKTNFLVFAASFSFMSVAITRFASFADRKPNGEDASCYRSSEDGAAPETEIHSEEC